MATRAQVEARLAAINQKKVDALKALQARSKKLKSQLARFDRPSKSQRRLDARRKILIGAFVLDQLELAGRTPEALVFEGKRFADWLTRPNDRAVFELSSSGTPTTPKPANAATFLNVPFEDKDRAKALGAHWDAGKKRWYVPAGIDLGPFKAWLDSA
jgi:hypothetical protein